MVWASGTSGTYLETTDGGATWRVAVVPGAEQLDFRGVHGVDDRTAYLLSSGSGDKSRIYKTTDGGSHWVLQFTNPDPKGFFDALAFWNARHGVAIGDPVDGRFVILTTGDGGGHWVRQEGPAALPNEGAFAASNSCLTLMGTREIWFATGGPGAARVFHSRDAGRTWTVAPRRFATMELAPEFFPWHSRMPCTGSRWEAITLKPKTARTIWRSPPTVAGRGQNLPGRILAAFVQRWLSCRIAACGSSPGRRARMFQATTETVGNPSIPERTMLSALCRAASAGLLVRKADWRNFDDECVRYERPPRSLSSASIFSCFACTATASGVSDVPRTLATAFTSAP